MKANVLHNINDLRYEEVDLPILKEGEVLLRVKACGICGSDVGRVFKTGTYHFPTIIGHEFSGEVVQVFNKEDEGLLNKKASVFPLIPCKECVNCLSGHYETCTNYNYLGSRTDGGFAEYVAVPKWNLQLLPTDISWEAAAMFEPAAVALHTLKRAKATKNDRLVVFGPGTIGLILCQVAKALGVEQVLLIGRSQDKLDYALSKGFATAVCNSTTEDVAQWIAAQTNGLMATLSVEGTGVAATLSHCINVTAAQGRIVAMGNPSEDFHIEKSVYWQLLRKQQTLIGTWNSSYKVEGNDWDEIQTLVATHQINLEELVTHRFPMSNLLGGLEVMRSRSEFVNKVMILNESSDATQA